MFEPITTKLSLRDRIVQDVLTKIEENQLKIGDRLLPERDLAAAYQVSRTVVRDALRTLAGLGVVSIRHGQGIFIRGNHGIALGQALWEPFVVRPDTVTLLFEVRRSLEVDAAGLAACRASEEQKAHLLSVVEEAKASVVDGAVDLSVASEADQLFHTGLFMASGNPIAGRLMINLLDLLEEVRKKSLAIPGRAVLSMLDHERVARAIAAGDGPTARAAMRDHLHAVEAAILSAFQAESESIAPEIPKGQG